MVNPLLHEIKDEKFDVIYRQLVNDVLRFGLMVDASKGRIKETVGTQITLLNIAKDRIDFEATKAFYRQQRYEKYIKSELSWYQSGDLRASSAPSRKWLELQDENGNINSNYGYLLFHKMYNVNGVAKNNYNLVVDLLKSRPNSKQAIFQYFSAEHLNNPKDIPCTLSAQVLIREDRLNLTVFQRSCDLYYGLPFDVPWHTYLMRKLFEDLQGSIENLELGNLTIQFGSLHIYEKDIKFFEKYLEKREVKVG